MVATKGAAVDARASHDMDGRDLAYNCAKCGHSTGLTTANLFPTSVFWQHGTKGLLSFQEAPGHLLEGREETSCGPFWESRNSWGISRTRTLLYCRGCGAKMGAWRADGPISGGGAGVGHFGPSQYSHRVTRLSLKVKKVQGMPSGEKPQGVPKGK
eukprot:TRINITY_DN26666_c0_g1_i1.p1 TRINITY_DN26666_c0_g1~~TRINITY_DN26666_c0_g1_i1.p1  ORF type:complete len:156 (-),score=11.22 TRINITY_DN26666_c0_g1_i1:267-734(-)